MHHHGAGLRRLLKDRTLCAAIAQDHTAANLEGRQRAMLDYAVKLTQQPGRMDSGDVDTLREAGLEDAEILDVCQVTAYYNYVNRLADGLGVELEWYWEKVRDAL